MFNINSFLDKFRANLAKDSFLLEMIQSTIKKTTHIEIPIKNIHIKSGRVSIIGVSSVVKSELFLKKTDIIQKINNQGGYRNIRDIN